MSETSLPTQGYNLIVAERSRQIELGYDVKHDSKHGRGNLIRAAMCYEHGNLTLGWPFLGSSWKPKDPLTNLIRAGALYYAALDVPGIRDSDGELGVARCAEKIDALLLAVTEVTDATTDSAAQSNQASQNRQCPRNFALVRDEDISGVSGTGTIAWGTQFPDNTVVLRWCTPDMPATTAVHENLDSVTQIHGHGGTTRIVWYN